MTVKPARKPKEGLTEAQVRAIVRDELRKLNGLDGPQVMDGWKHDAAHSATQAQVTAQWERDKAAGVALTG